MLAGEESYRGNWVNLLLTAAYTGHCVKNPRHSIFGCNFAPKSENRAYNYVGRCGH